MTFLSSLFRGLGGMFRVLFSAPILGHFIFWSWHAIYLTFMAFGLVPYVIGPVVELTFKGHIPLGFGLSALGLMFLPLASFGLGVWKFRKDSRKLLRLFYGVFAPGLLLLLCRMFLVREMTPGVEHVLWTLGLGIAAYLAELLWDLEDGPVWLEVLRMLGHALLLVSGVYCAVLLGFFAFPLFGGFFVHFIPELLKLIPEIPGALLELLTEIFKFDWLWQLPKMTLGMIAIFFALCSYLVMMSYSATLFTWMPVALVGLFVASWHRAHTHFGRRFGGSLALGVTALAVTVSAVVFVRVNAQPQQSAFEALVEAPADDAARFALLAREDALREGLLNAYLSPWRYQGSTGQNHALERYWKDAMDLEKGTAEPVQAAFNVIAAPLTYEGDSTSQDSDRAGVLYAEFFDRSIQEAEREAVLRSVTSTWDSDEVEAGLLNVGQQKVHLEEQQITVTEHGDYAEIEIHEVYRNQTLDQQEILYLFNLPVSAAVTGLWLGDTEDRSMAFPYTVAPRGAAQAVYKAERDRQVDPALLEQLGPRQYRLRAFPIPPKEDSRFSEAPEFHLWMTYTVAAQGDVYPLPDLAEARNIYWDDDTERSINDVEAEETEDWMWAVVEAEGEVERVSHVADLNGFRVRATPITDEWGADLRGDRYAVVLDTSYSMNAYTEEVTEALAWLKAEIAPTNEVDLFLAHSPYRGEASEWAELSTFEVSSTPFFGGSSYDKMLRTFDEARGSRSYDTIVLLTDGGSSALVEDGMEASLGAPLWMVHFGGLSPSYDDGTLDALQAYHGGATERVQSVFQRRSLLADAPESVVDVADGYIWSLEEQDTAGVSEAEFAPLAARQLVLHLSRVLGTRSNTTLDLIHEVAVEQSIATPFSSMIVLVNDEQRERLKKASEAEDRFERETESGEEALSKPNNGMEVSGTPEPEEWLLIILACGMLFQVARRRKLEGLAL